MGTFNFATVGACLVAGAALITTSQLSTLPVQAATHGPDTVQAQSLFDGFRMSHAATRQSGRSVLTLAGNPREAATNRIARHLNADDGKAEEGRIDWFVNDARGAYRRAVKQGKPLVLVFGTAECGFCQKLLTEVLPCNSINRLAARAVFAYSEPVSDRAAGQIAAKLQVTQAPTISVIEPARGSFEERARITGYFSATQVSGDLEKFLASHTSQHGPAFTVIPASAGTGDSEPNSCAR